MGSLVAFLIAFAESVPLLGTIIPGSVTMTLIGVGIGRGMMPMLQTLSAATCGALLGDIVGFTFGRYYNVQLRSMWPFKKYPHWLKKSEAFFEKHGGKSIIFGRFIGPARSSVPLIAGFLKMTSMRFLLAALPSSFFWAVIYIFPGILIGAASLTLPPGLTTKFMLISFLFIVLLWLIFWIIQRFFSFLVLTINRWIDRFWSWLYHHHSAKFLTWITNRRTPTDHHQLTLLILACLGLLIFTIFLIIAKVYGPLTHFNTTPFYLLQGLRFLPLDKFFVATTLFGAMPTILVITVLSTFLLIIKRQRRAAYYMISTFIVSAAAVYLFKTLIYSPRPTGFLSIIKSSSFPSGHTCLALTIFGLIAFLIAEQIPKRWRPIPYAVASLLITLVGISRLYLGAHWLEDVLASVGLGFAILLTSIMLYRRYSPDPWAYTKLLLPLFLILILPWIGFSAFEFKKTMYYSSPEWITKYIAFNSWWEYPTQYVPIYRLNRLGHPTQPLNIQCAEFLANIQQQLLNQGWVVVQHHYDLQKTLGRFISHMPAQQLPLLPWLYEQQPPVLFMIKHLPHQARILELRLWASHIQFIDSKVPLWVGSINYRLPKHNLLTLKKTPSILFEKTDKLMQDMIHIFGHCLWKMIQTPRFSQPQAIQALQWTGAILIVTCHAETKALPPKTQASGASIFYESSAPDNL